MQQYNALTKDKDQMQFILKVVKEHLRLKQVTNSVGNSVAKSDISDNPRLVT